MKALRAEHGGPYVLAANAHAWLASLPDPTGAARKNADLWGKDLDAAAADFATGNLYALAWLLARAQPTPAEQAATLRAVRAVRAGPGLDRRALPRHFQGRHGARRPAAHRGLPIAGFANAAEADHRAMPYETIAVRKVTPAIGAEISGVDLAGPLSNRQVSELHDALMAHQVIFFRDQQMSVDQHKAFGRLFGELLIHPAARAEVEGHPEIRVVHADEKTEVATGEVWHSDMSCEPEPPMGSILYLHQSPPVGGDTAFANMYLAYETLSEPIKRLVEGLSAFHTSAHVYSRGAYERSDKRVSRGGASDRAPPPGDGAEMPVHQPRLHQAHRGAEEARERRAAGDAGAPRRDAGIPVPLPLGQALRRLLGQSLRHAPRHVRLSPARAARPSRDDQGRPAVLIISSTTS